MEWVLYDNGLRHERVKPMLDRLFFVLLTDGGGAREHPRSKICYTYPTMMKLGTVIPYLKKIHKMLKLHDTLLEFCVSCNQQFLFYQEMQIKIAF